MSEFYRLKRDHIIKNYGFLEPVEIFVFYLLCFFKGSAITLLLYYFVNINTTIENSTRFLMLLVIVIVANCFYNHEMKKRRLTKKKAIILFIKEPDININVVKKLMEELESNIKRIKTYATWIAGIAATFMVMFATVISNYFYKMADAYIKACSNDELLSYLENRKGGSIGENLLNGFFDYGVPLLIIFLLIISIIYLAFCAISFIKKQILIFLYDVQYEMLLDIGGQKPGVVEMTDVKGM